jgi:hypothetical protein
VAFVTDYSSVNQILAGEDEQTSHSSASDFLSSVGYDKAPNFTEIFQTRSIISQTPRQQCPFHKQQGQGSSSVAQDHDEAGTFHVEKRAILNSMQPNGCAQNIEAKSVPLAVLAKTHDTMHDSLESMGKGEFSFYNLVKEVATQLMLDWTVGPVGHPFVSNGTRDKLKTLHSTHWHGIGGVPMQLDLPSFGFQSVLSKAAKARDLLLDEYTKLAVLRQDAIKNGVFVPSADISCMLDNLLLENIDPSVAAANMLLLGSSIVAKCLASLCTSVVFELSQVGNKAHKDTILAELRMNKETSTTLDKFIKETERLHPPFLGGCRGVQRKELIPKDSTGKGPYLTDKDQSGNKLKEAGHPQNCKPKTCPSFFSHVLSLVLNQNGKPRASHVPTAARVLFKTAIYRAASDDTL